MAKKNHSSTPSQVHVPANRKDPQEFGGMHTAGSTAIGPNRLMTPNRERIGTGAMPVPGEGGHSEFTHETHHASGKRRG